VRSANGIRNDMAKKHADINSVLAKKCILGKSTLLPNSDNPAVRPKITKNRIPQIENQKMKPIPAISAIGPGFGPYSTARRM